MYRLLTLDIDHHGELGSGVLVLCDETHVVEYLEHDTLELVSQFVEFLDITKPGVLMVSNSFGRHRDLLLTDIFNRGIIENLVAGSADTRVNLYRSAGYLVGKSLVRRWMTQSILKKVCSPAVMLRYKLLSIIDTDDCLWFLDPDETPQLRLSDFCRSVMKKSIMHEFRFNTVFIFDDKLEYVSPECFIWRMGKNRSCKPKVICDKGLVGTLVDVEVVGLV